MCVCVCMYVCMCIYMCIYIYIIETSATWYNVDLVVLCVCVCVCVYVYTYVTYMTVFLNRVILLLNGSYVYFSTVRSVL